MAPPKKPSHQRVSSNPFKKNSNKKPDLDEEYYQANTKFVENDSDNRIGAKAIAKQLLNAPNPRETGKSGYPHKFYNDPGKTQITQLARSDSAASSTTSLYEFPVLSNGHDYDYHKKPRDDPGHIRAITNQNKRFKGVVAHNGEDGDPKRGDVHWVEKEARKK